MRRYNMDKVLKILFWLILKALDWFACLVVIFWFTEGKFQTEPFSLSLFVLGGSCYFIVWLESIRKELV